MHAVSTYVADVMAHRLRYPRRKIVVIPRGRDARRLGRRTEARRAAARNALQIDDTTPVVLAVARHEYQKGLDVLLDAAMRAIVRLPTLQVLVAGREGTQSEALRARARDQGVENDVCFLGARDDVAELLCAADVFVLPSRREGLPGSALEAMALEVPIVASDLPQVRELVDESMAHLVRPDVPAELAEAIVDALTANGERRQRVTRARDRFMGEFTIEGIARQTASFYRDVVSRASDH
jgi:glycosyltransferase involved in cell wall biosynthesis